jgi:metallophosphoesterase (TIGR00282 family)
LKFLVIGDIVGISGMNKLKLEYNKLVEENNIDFVIINGENSAGGKGLRIKEYDEIMGLGTDVITMGNHIYYRKEMAEEYIKLPRLLVPANVTNLNANGSVIVEKNGFKIGVLSLLGKVGLGEIAQEHVLSPFETARKEVNKLKENGAKYIFLDFHAEATAEKIAMGYFLENDITCMFGTHTHVQTADEEIINGRMAYITDVGMTGPKNSVIGLKKETALVRFSTGAYAKYECSNNEATLNGIIVSTDDLTGNAIKIERISIK